MMIRRSGILLAIRVVGTGAPLSTINRGSHKKSIANKFDSSSSSKIRTTPTPRASNITTPPSEQRFHKLLRSSTETFEQDLAEYLASSPTQPPPAGMLGRFFPRLHDISNPFEYTSEEDVHRRAAVRYLLLHHDCNPVTLSFSPHDSPAAASSAARMLLLYACANVGQLSSLVEGGRWERTGGAGGDGLLLLDPNMSAKDTIRVLTWIGGTCSSNNGRGSLTGLSYTKGSDSKQERFHIPTTHLFRALQNVVKCETSNDVDIKWLVKQTTAAKEFEATLPRQSGTSKRIDLVGGRAHWATLVYNPQARSVVGTAAATTSTSSIEDDSNNSSTNKKKEGGQEDNKGIVTSTVRHLCASFDQVSLDILRWHADGKIQQLQDFVRMVCDLKSSLSGEGCDDVGANEIQTLFLLGVLGAMAVDGAAAVCPKDDTVPTAATTLREAFITSPPNHHHHHHPLIYWGELLQELILTSSRMLLSPPQLSHFVTTLLKPTQPIHTGRHIANKLQSRINAEYAIYLELLANVDPITFVQEYGTLHPTVVLCPTSVGAIIKALVLQYVLTGPASKSELEASIHTLVSQLAPKDGFLYFGALSIESNVGNGTGGKVIPAELEAAFGHLSSILSLDDVTLSKWNIENETVVDSQVSVKSDSAATILLGRRHRSVTTTGLSRLATNSSVLPLITATNVPPTEFNVSLWKIDVAKILLKFRTDVFVNTSNTLGDTTLPPHLVAGVAARISFANSSVDEQLVVLSKPSGMASSLYCPPQQRIIPQPVGGDIVGNSTDSGNIVSSLLGPLHADVYAHRADGEEQRVQQQPVRVFNELGLLNRLDAHTTGVMLAVIPCVPQRNRNMSTSQPSSSPAAIDIAKYISTCANVSHTLEKKYLALVHHHSIRPKSKPSSPKKGTLEWLLPTGVLNTHVGTVVGNTPTTSGADTVGSSSRSLYTGPLLESTRTLNASTKYRIVRSYPTSRSYLVELTLTSGRRHQIRQHMAKVGFPLYGDVMYGGIRGPSLIQRTALHATSITIPLQATSFNNGTTTPLDHVTIESGDTVEGVSTQKVRVTRAPDGKAVTVGVALPADMQALISELESREQRK